jgi:hypothetical protein
VDLKATLQPSNTAPGPMLNGVAALIEKRITERSAGRTIFEVETCENKGVHWIEATTTANGLTYPV